MRSLNLRLFTVIKLLAVVIYDVLSKRGVDEEQEERDRATGFAATNNRELTQLSVMWTRLAPRH